MGGAASFQKEASAEMPETFLLYNPVSLFWKLDGADAAGIMARVKSTGCASRPMVTHSFIRSAGGANKSSTTKN